MFVPKCALTRVRVSVFLEVYTRRELVRAELAHEGFEVHVAVEAHDALVVMFVRTVVALP